MTAAVQRRTWLRVAWRITAPASLFIRWRGPPEPTDTTYRGRMVCQHKILWSFRSTEAALLAGAASAAGCLRGAPRTESPRTKTSLQRGSTAVFGGTNEMASREIGRG